MEGNTDSVSTGTTPAAAPLTFEQAFAADASSASPTTDTAQSPGTTAPDASVALPQAVGEPPQERWPTILENARRKAAEEALAPVAWAKDIPRESFDQMAQWYRQAQQDPVAFAQNLINELQAHPEHGKTLRSMAARALSSGRQQPAPMPDLSQVVVDLGNGQTISLADFKASILGEVDQKYAPVAQTAAEIKEEREALAVQTAAKEFGVSVGKDANTWPGMDNAEKVAELREWMRSQPLTTGDPREVELLLNAGYRKFILPHLSARAQSAQLDHLQQKAHASTGVNPGSAAPSTPARPKSFMDPSLTW